MTPSAGARVAPLDKRFFEALDEFDERIPLPRLSQWLAESPLSLDDLRPFLKFSSERYVRNLIQAGRAYHALAICWRNSQRSPIHDHHGSSCAVKVLQGVATETVFAVSPNGLIYATHSRELPEGHRTASQDSDIHQMSNLQAVNRELITLHVYSPPLMNMHVYSLVDAGVTRFFDPVHDELLAGGGI